MRNWLLLCAALLSFQGAAALDWDKDLVKELKNAVKDTGGKWNKAPEGAAEPGLAKVGHKALAKRAWIVPQAVVHRGRAYLAMSDSLQAAILKGPAKGQTAAAVVNGIAAGRSNTRIKTPYDVLCTLAQDGTNGEAMVDKDDRVALEALGAKVDKFGRVPARVYLSFELANPVDEIRIEIPGEKPVVEVLTVLLYF